MEVEEFEKEMGKDLRPCPFCGAIAEYVYCGDDYNHDCIVCTNEECGASLTKYPYEGKELVYAWNKRC